MDDNRAAVLFHQPMDYGETHAQPAFGTGQCAFGLRKNIENTGQQCERNTHAIVSNRNVDSIVDSFGSQMNRAAMWRVFCSVIQQIADHLYQSVTIAVDT